MVCFKSRFREIPDEIQPLKLNFTPWYFIVVLGSKHRKDRSVFRWRLSRRARQTKRRPGWVNGFSQSFHNTRIPILATLFWLCHLKFKRAIKSPTLKGNLFCQLPSNLTFTKIFKIQVMKKTANILHGNTKLALTSLLPTLWHCDFVKMSKKHLAAR